MLYPRAVSSLSFFCVSFYLCPYRLLHSYFTYRLILCLYLLWFSACPRCGQWYVPFVLSPVSFWEFLIILWAHLTFWHNSMFRGHFIFSLPQPWGQPLTNQFILSINICWVSAMFQGLVWLPAELCSQVLVIGCSLKTGRSHFLSPVP